VAAENVVESIRSALETVNDQIKKLKTVQRDLEIKLERALFLQSNSEINPSSESTFCDEKSYQPTAENVNFYRKSSKMPVDENEDEMPSTQKFSSSSLAASKSRSARLYDLSTSALSLEDQMKAPTIDDHKNQDTKDSTPEIVSASVGLDELVEEGDESIVEYFV
jgi:hypothetical protein